MRDYVQRGTVVLNFEASVRNIFIIGRTAKSVTELLSFLATIYGGGFLQILTVTSHFSYEKKDVVTK